MVLKNQHKMIQKSVLAAISAPTFILTFPHLEQATWSKILSKSKENLELNEQLEFLGDAVMYACVAAGLLAQIPQASPGVLTVSLNITGNLPFRYPPWIAGLVSFPPPLQVLRGPLTTNATFAHLIDKLDLPSVAEGSSLPMSDFFRRPSSKSPFKSKTEVKRAADAFEVVCGAIYLQDGYLPLCNWVLDTFRPLISAAYRSYNHWTKLKIHNRNEKTLSRTLRRLRLMKHGKPGLKSLKKNKLQKRLLHKPKAGLSASVRHLALQQYCPDSQATATEVIDLTAEDDDEDMEQDAIAAFLEAEEDGSDNGTPSQADRTTFRDDQPLTKQTSTPLPQTQPPHPTSFLWLDQNHTDSATRILHHPHKPRPLGSSLNPICIDD